jgi:hypothetical protein
MPPGAMESGDEDTKSGVMVLAKAESSLELKMEVAEMHDCGVLKASLRFNEASHVANKYGFKPDRSCVSIRAIECIASL